MSGSQHNPNGRQSQLGPGWSPLQLQVANFLARAPQAHMAERGVTWHTPTPPPHLYHVPAPSPPDPLQAMKSASNSVFRHTATPPELYRHTPTPPDKHMLRHTPSPGDVKAGAALPPTDLYSHLGVAREKLLSEEACRGGVDLSVSNRGPLSVRDAPTINSLIARAQPRGVAGRVEALLERLVPAPAPAPASVIVHAPLHNTPSPPESNEDSADSCGAPPGSKRKRKPERTIRVPTVGAPALSPAAPPGPPAGPPAQVPVGPPAQAPVGPPAGPPMGLLAGAPATPPRAPAASTTLHHHTTTDIKHTPNTTHKHKPTTPEIPYKNHKSPIENGETEHKVNGPEDNTKKSQDDHKPPSPDPHARRKTRSESETIDDIAAMIASTEKVPIVEEKPPEVQIEQPVTIDKLESVLASPDGKPEKKEEAKTSPPHEEKEIPPETVVGAAAAPKRRATRTSNSESTNVPIESPSEAKPAESEASEAPTAEPTAASFVEVENQLEKMFAGIEEPKQDENQEENSPKQKGKKRRKSAANKGNNKRRAKVAELRKGEKKNVVGKSKKEGQNKDAYDSGSNASSSKSRGPYIQIRGPCESPSLVCVMNSAAGEEEETARGPRAGAKYRNGARARGLHASTLGLRYDATTPDATWLCAFCERGPHAGGLGDLFGPYTADTDCEEYRMLDEATRQKYEALPNPSEVWFHEACAVWAPGLVAWGARVWGLAGAVWGARGGRCGCPGCGARGANVVCAARGCGARGANVVCAARGCRARAHVPCALRASWAMSHTDFRAHCPHHAPSAPAP